MRVVRLSAANVMRLKAVEIEPNGTVQIVAGENGAGKSSLLNALWLALGGGAASREIAKPIREGEDWAEVTLDLGDDGQTQITVTRSWDAEKDATKLTVKYADGSIQKSPQTLLDQMLGKLSFDPLAFTRLSAKDQRDALLNLLDLDFTEQDAIRSRLYDTRLQTGRDMHAYGDLPKLDRNAPMVEKSATEIVSRLNESNRIRQQESQLRWQVRERQDRIGVIEKRIAELIETIDNLRKEMHGHEEAIQAIEFDINELPEQENTTALEAELAEVEEFNKTVRENQRIAANREAQKKLEDEYTELGRQIKAIDDKKAKTLAATKMPVEGLGFDDSGVTFKGVPFDQASAAEKIRVSLAMAAALNPTLRVIRIIDGSLLDKTSMAAVREIAEEFDMQLWIEVVSDDPDDPTAVVISEGEVVVR